MLNKIVNIIKLIKFIKKAFKKIVLQNIAKNALFNNRKFFFSSKLFSEFAIFTLFVFINFINQLLKSKLQKIIKIINKKNIKK